MSKPSDLVQGALDLLLALEPLNGWAISQRLKAVSGDVLQVSDGSLYPALHKLEATGAVALGVARDREQPPRAHAGCGGGVAGGVIAPHSSGATSPACREKSQSIDIRVDRAVYGRHAAAAPLSSYT